ncbi:MAG: D-sedoheptulose-7-phosphate isomerase [Chloroflexota bacterium]
MRSDIEQYWSNLGDLSRTMPFKAMERAAKMLLDCQRRGGTVFVAGNGGSAATASHFACDLAKGTRTEGLAPFRVAPLTDNVPLITAWANDADFTRVFAEQLRCLVRPGDVVLAISTSGESPNVLALAEAAREFGARTIALTGRRGGRLRFLADLTICVPADGIELVEDAHSMIAHSLCVALRQRLQQQQALSTSTA